MPDPISKEEEDRVRAAARKFAKELMRAENHPHNGRWRCVVCAEFNWSCVDRCEGCETPKPADAPQA